MTTLTNGSLSNGSLSTGYCPSCGEDVDIQANGRCPRGHLTMTATTQKGLDKQIFKPSTLDTKSWNELNMSPVSNTSSTGTPVAGTPVAEVEQPKPKEVVVLPPSRVARLWVQQTQALIVSLQGTKAKLEAGIKMERKNIARIEKAIVTLSAHLEGYEVADSPALLKADQWANNHEKCVVCGTTERKHKSGGRCVSCDGAFRRGVNQNKNANGE